MTIGCSLTAWFNLPFIVSMYDVTHCFLVKRLLAFTHTHTANTVYASKIQLIWYFFHFFFFHFLFEWWNCLCRSRWEDTLSLPINNNTVYVTPSAGGPLIAFVLNILRGYHFTSKAIESDDDRTLTYHRFIEAFKFGESN